MLKSKEVRTKIQFGAITFFCILLLSFLLFTFLSPNRDYRKQMKFDIRLLSQSEYNSVLCGMFSLDNYDTADIAYYTGLNTLKLDCILKNTRDLATYLNTAFHSGNTIDTVYLGIDPETIWKTCGRNSQKTTKQIHANILSYAQENPQVQFQIILSAPSMDYWTGKTSDEVDDCLAIYRTVINSLTPCENVLTHFIGAEEWFISNPGNYVDPITATADGAAKQLVFTLGHKYLITPDTAQSIFDKLQTLIRQKQTSHTEYPDLSSWDVVFFGDSIIGNYTGSTSVPNAVSSLTGAHNYNCGIGGASASVATHYPINFLEMVNAFISGDTSNLSNAPEDTPFSDSLEKYREESDSRRNLCFVLNYGLNDYIHGLPVADPQNPKDITTYAGALREGISLLQHHYPDAVIVVMAPTFTSSYSCGTNINSEKGSVLTDYVDTAQMIAEETKSLFINNYANLGINKDNVATYLADTIHPNETGRFLMAQQIALQFGLLITQ